MSQLVSLADTPRGYRNTALKSYGREVIPYHEETDTILTDQGTMTAGWRDAGRAQSNDAALQHEQRSCSGGWHEYV